MFLTIGFCVGVSHLMSTRYGRRVHAGGALSTYHIDRVGFRNLTTRQCLLPLSHLH